MRDKKMDLFGLTQQSNIKYPGGLGGGAAYCGDSKYNNQQTVRGKPKNSYTATAKINKNYIGA
jgi:hypothetical protein